MTVTGKNTYSGTCTATFNVKGTALPGSGTENAPYLISSSDAWNDFVGNVSEGISYDGQFIALADDISITSTVGTEANPFKGTFNGSYNGQSHTMTVNINDTTDQGTAPFRTISDGAVIKNLTVEGTVTGTTHAAGLVGFSRGGSSEAPNTIENCIVNVNVSVPATSGSRHMGGVVGHGVTSHLKIADTVFGGTMYNNANYAGGLMGWCDSGCDLTIDNCLFKGSYTGTASNGFHPIAICNNNATVTTNVQNCYYTADPTLTSAGYIPVATGEKVYSFAPFGYTTEEHPVSDETCYEVIAEPQSTLTINDYYDWESFAQSVTNGFTYEGIVIELNSDFGVTDMVGGTFKGTLNGKGHQITFNYTQETAEDAALFKAIDGATIEFLEVVGTINTSKKYAAAIAAHTYGTININSCISRITINSSIDGDGTHGGFVAVAEGGSTLNISNSLFAGAITGSNTTKCAGFVGWRNGTLHISNSLMAGTLNINVTSDSATFSRNNDPTLTNSYYRTSYGKVQGTAVGDKTNDELVQDLGRMWTISNDEVVPAFDVLDKLDYATVSGINTLYAYTGNVIDIEPVVTAVDGTVLSEGADYTAAITKDGETVSSVKDSGTYTYTFTPADGSSFTGTLTSAEFTVGLVDLSTATVSGINAEYIYSGSDINITPVIKAADGKTLTDGTDYTTTLTKDGEPANSVNGVGTYTYTFTGVEAQGYTGAKTVEFTVKLAKPTGIQQTAYGSDTAALSWDAQNNVTGYELQYSKDSTFPEGSGTVTVTENTAALTGLDTDSKYYARVRALNGDYSSEWSNTATFETTSKRWVGFGATSSSGELPFNNWYNFSVSEQLYTVQEIGEAGLITSVDLMKVQNEGCVRNIDVYMVHTDKAYFSGSSDAVAVTEADKVFSGTVNFAYNEWTTIKFEKSFNYNGTQNVVLVIDDNTGSYSTSTSFKAFSINNTEALSYHSDNYNYSPTDVSNISWSSSASKNAVRFGIGAGHTVSIDQDIQNGTASTTTTKEIADNKVTFSVNPDEGYYCAGVSVNDGAVEVTKNADGTYSFTMPDEDAVISATYAQRFNVTVTWKNWDGTVLDTQQVGVEEVPAYSGETPTRPDDDYYSYTFKGWDKEAEAITENAPVELTAVYNRQPFYQVPFTVCDGTDSNRYAPYYGYYNDIAGNITQSVYPSSMLANMAGKDVYSLTYYMQNGGIEDIVVKGMKVYLLEVDSDTLTGITNVADNANAVKVFEGNYKIGTSGTVRIDFTTSFHYNGGHLLISIQDSLSGDYVNKLFYGTNTNNVSSYNSYGSTGTSVKFLAKCSFGMMDESKYSVTLPENMEFCDGSSATAVAGSTVQFKVKEGYTASNVKANDTELTAENGIYSLMVKENVEVTADIAEITNSYVSGANLSLEGDIGINVYLKASSAVVNDDGAYVTVQGPNDAEPVRYLLSSLEIKDGYGYKITSLLNAKQMGESVTVRLYNGNDEEQKIYGFDQTTEYADGYSYGPKDYFATVESGTYSAALTNLVSAMKNYGEYAREYFGYSTVVCTPTEIEGVTADTLSGYKTEISGTHPEGVEYYGSSLLLKSQTAFRFYFNGTPENFTVTDENGSAVTAYNSGMAQNMFYIEIPDIAAKDLDKKFTVTIGDYSVTACAMTYAYNALNLYASDANKTALCNVAKAIYKYNEAAKAYFNSQNA